MAQSRESLIALNLAGLGSLQLKKLLEYFANPANILKASSQELYASGALKQETAQRLRAVTGRQIEKEINRAKKNRIDIIGIDDPGYPRLLHYLPDPPVVLYVKGGLSAQDLCIAVVGSRRASLYGLAVTEMFSTQLSLAGFTIVSGMARGVDTCAHKAALKAGARTIAVMGSGFDNIYPPENAQLAQRISAQGAVISEYPFSEPPGRFNFPRRNRIISGLSWGVLVSEAARNSGALITADCALDQCREVFCVPGMITSEGSSGNHELIKQGAKLVSCVEDILEELEMVITAAGAQTEQRLPDDDGQLSCREGQVYAVIKEAPQALDEIVRASGGQAAEVSAALTRLELKRKIKRVCGGLFARL